MGECVTKAQSAPQRAFCFLSCTFVGFSAPSRYMAAEVGCGLWAVGCWTGEETRTDGEPGAEQEQLIAPQRPPSHSCHREEALLIFADGFLRPPCCPPGQRRARLTHEDLGPLGCCNKEMSRALGPVLVRLSARPRVLLALDLFLAWSCNWLRGDSYDTRGGPLRRAGEAMAAWQALGRLSALHADLHFRDISMPLQAERRGRLRDFAMRHFLISEKRMTLAARGVMSIQRPWAGGAASSPLRLEWETAFRPSVQQASWRVRPPDSANDEGAEWWQRRVDEAYQRRRGSDESFT